MKALAPLALAIALFCMGAVAQASVPDSDGTIHGCYVKTSGALRVSDKCKATEAPLWWRQGNPPLPSGTVVGLTMMVGSLDPNTYTTNETSVPCPDGKVAIAGTGYFDSEPMLVQVADSSAFRTSVEVDWSKYALTPSSRVSYTVTCGTVTP